MQRSLYLVAYDISDDRLRRRMLRVVRGYASRGQKSALECWLSPTEARELLSKARPHLDIGNDCLGLLPLDPRRGVITLGQAMPPADPAFLYFG